MKVGIIIQARMGSTRLTGKILLPLPFGSDTSVLQQVIRRAKKSKEADIIVVATTGNDEDCIITEVAAEENVFSFRGSENDVLSRYYHAAKEYSVDLIVRVTSDCPCIDPELLDNIVRRAKDVDSDYTGNTLNRTFPRGLDVEAIKFSALEKAYLDADKDYEREHVTDHIYENPIKFKLESYEHILDEDYSNIRVTVDTYEDYMLLCAVYDYLYKEEKEFDYKMICDLFKEKPWLYLINNDITQKKYKESGSY